MCRKREMATLKIKATKKAKREKYKHYRWNTQQKTGLYPPAIRLTNIIIISLWNGLISRRSFGGEGRNGTAQCDLIHSVTCGNEPIHSFWHFECFVQTNPFISVKGIKHTCTIEHDTTENAKYAMELTL